MGGLFGGGPKMPDMSAMQRAAEERAAREKKDADQRAAAETRARQRTQGGRMATLLTDERERLNRAGLLG